MAARAGQRPNVIAGQHGGDDAAASRHRSFCNIHHHDDIATAAGLALLLAAAPARAQDKTVELKLSHWVPPTHPLQKAMEEWGASIEKASGGTIKSKVFPSQQLGKAFDHYDMARDGIADLTYVNPGYQPGPLPDHLGRRIAVPGRRRQGRHPRRSTPGIANTPPPR